jgi:hypothetical protein
VAVDLVFQNLQSTSTNLVFGENDAPPIANALVDFVADLPAFGSAIAVRAAVGVGFSGSFPAFAGDIGVTYETNAERPTVAATAVPWEDANDVQSGFTGVWQDGDARFTSQRLKWQPADRAASSATGRWQQGENLRNARSISWQRGIPARRSNTSAFQQGVAVPRSARSLFSPALHLDNLSTALFQEALRDRRNLAAVVFQDGERHYVSVGGQFFFGTPLYTGGMLVYQEAMRPPPGISPVGPGPEPEDPCYLPDTNLVFAEGPGDTNLVFICERHPGPQPGETVVVPVRRVYVVVNSATLTRVSDGVGIPTTSMSMTLDVDSWTWSFSASVPGAALSFVSRVGGEPVEVLATINGTAYRFVIEQVARERTFGSNSLRVAGRGRIAFLDAPYAPTMSFINTEARTAQQLMGDVLTINGVPLGWGVNWSPDDWTVPTGAFSHQGSYISAITTIAASTGAYIRPHASAQEFDVLLKYPVAPWEWGTLTPDYELPSAVVTKESVEWLEKAEYNRVFVGGTAQGVFGPVTRDGTDGLLLASQITDPLITAAAPHRQRGLTVLSDVGSQERVTLSLPVLSETGVIPPGKFVRYVDGARTRIGLTRSVNVSLGASAVDLRQQIVLETHNL